MCATLEGSSVDKAICLLSASFGWMDILEVLELGMTESGGEGEEDSTKDSFTTDVVDLSAISQLSLSQS
jgi:hypothetical protein